MRVCVTGGAGFIGSHIVYCLLMEGYDVSIVDDFSNSSRRVIDRLRSMTGKEPQVIECDVADSNTINALKDADAVIHLAGLKSVAESVAQPMKYYETNVVKTMKLLNMMKLCKVNNIIFSSSATVYGRDATPATEETTKSPQNAYARSKSIVEDILMDVSAAEENKEGLNVAVLRYFNPVGAHPSGLIGEVPNGPPNNLMPYMTQTAAGIREKLTVFGDDYDTPDGTAMRDYIHVMDLAEAHVAVLKSMMGKMDRVTYNVGTGNPVSVKEIVEAFKTNACGIPVGKGPRRDGDVPVSFADCTRIQNEIQWQPKRTLVDMCVDSWNFQKNNPGGI